MSIAVLLTRLVLLAVFVTSGAAKLADRAGTRNAVTGFGVPARFAGPLAIAVTVAELVIAVGLLPRATAAGAAIAAVILLGIFLTAITYNLALGRKPDCHCFGQIHSAPVGPRTLALNVALLALAGFAAWRGFAGEPGPSLIAWVAGLQAVELATLLAGGIALALLAGIATLMWQMLRQQGRILLRLEDIEARLTGSAAPAPEPAYDPLTMGAGLLVGAQAPAFDLVAVEGKRVTLDQLLEAKKPILLLFANANCGPCAALLPQVAQWQRDHAEAFSTVVISEGGRAENRKKIAVHGLDRVLLQRKQEIAEAYHAWGTPAALLVNPDGSIATRVAQGADRIQSLVDWAAAGARRHRNGSAAQTATVAVGERVPPVQLPDLFGKLADVTSRNEQRTMLLFWNPGCGFCQEMLADLRILDADRPPGAPELLVISTGSVEENRRMNLRSPVLIDQGFKVATMFGAGGTPMAVMLDGDGIVSSGVAGGADQVFALANYRPATAAERAAAH